MQEEEDDEDAFGSVALRRMPGLAVPFALVAASAAFFSVFAVGGDLWRMRDAASPLGAVAFAMVPGALAGAVIRRWRHLYGLFTTRTACVVRIALVVAAAGASIGAVIGWCAWALQANLGVCAVDGAVYALAFVPAALIVRSAAVRAARARLGSIVAGVDRRTVTVTLLGVIAFSAMTQGPALFFGDYSSLVHPLVQVASSVAVSAGCATAIALIRRRDHEARALLEAAAAQPWLERIDAIATEAGSAPALDLGLGAARWGRTSELATYRTAPRSEVVLRGSVDDARRAVDVALAQRRRALVFSLLTIAVTVGAFAIGAWRR